MHRKLRRWLIILLWSNSDSNIVLTSHNVDFRTLGLCLLDGKLVVYDRQFSPGGRELPNKYVAASKG